MVADLHVDMHLIEMMVKNQVHHDIINMIEILLLHVIIDIVIIIPPPRGKTTR